jgi:hypothetical protein
MYLSTLLLGQRLLNVPAAWTKENWRWANLRLIRPIYRLVTFEIFMCCLDRNVRYITCERSVNDVYTFHGLFYVGFLALPALREVDYKFADMLQEKAVIRLRRHFSVPFGAEVVLN